jgi:type IV secretion system protein TrbB
MKTPQEIQTERFMALLKRNLGAEVLNWLDDPDLTDLMINPDGKVWLHTHSRGMFAADFTLPPMQVEALIGAVAAALGTVADAKHAIVEGELQLDRVRFEGLVMPVVEQPCIALRKPAQVLYTLADYVRDGIIKPEWAELLREAVVNRQSIVIGGATGSGKTTAAAALLNEMVMLCNPTDRYIVIEDTREIQCKAQNIVFLRSNDDTDMTQLVKAAMRLFPTRIIVGETRDKAALAMLKAWLTHLGGITTVHATSVTAALSRLNILVQEAGVPAQPELIAETVNLMALIEQRREGRRMTELARLEGWSRDRGFIVSAL